MNVGSSEYFAQVSEYLSSNPKPEQHKFLFLWPQYPCKVCFSVWEECNLGMQSICAIDSFSHLGRDNVQISVTI